MKHINKTSITHKKHTSHFEQIFELPKASTYIEKQNIEIIYIRDLLKETQNTELLKKTKEKPAIYSNVYSNAEELSIFTSLFHKAIQNKQQTHIVGVSLGSELEVLEKYYEELGFLREDINCFRVDFSIPLVTVSVHIENLIRKGSDYKKMRDKIFFIPPIRESSENKALFKGINRGVIAGIHTNNFGVHEKKFLEESIQQEKILPLTLGKVLFYNLQDIGIAGKQEVIEISY